MAGSLRFLASRASHLRSKLSHLLNPSPRPTTAATTLVEAPPLADTAASEASARHEAHLKLKDLNFASAAEILSTYPSKKFGFDFHLVQFFFACMPSLAVYLVAQYARHEIRRMEGEVELKKKKAEEEEKAKAAELEAIEEGHASELEAIKEGPDSKLSKVIGRLDALEEAVREIVDEKKKTSQPFPTGGREVGMREKVGAPANENSLPERSNKETK